MITRSKDDKFFMYRYWEEKKGIHRALEEYYPNTLKADEVLRLAYTQLRLAEKAIASRMAELEVEEPDDEFY